MITEDYRHQLQLLHQRQTWGASGYSHAATVAAWAKKTGCRNVLDYGCGTGTLKPALASLGYDDVREYDPAISGKDRVREPADMLVATDVLEHIEPEFVESTLALLRRLARRAAFFTIALTPSKVSLPDGRNAHLVLLTKDQWIDRLHKAGFLIANKELRKGLWVWAR